jgi:acetoacetyl-CoA synthetase
VLLNGGASHHAAIVACHKDRAPDRISFGELRRRVERLAVRLQVAQIQPGDRVVAIARNNLEVVIIALASAAVGAVFSSCPHDLGSLAVLSRFHSLEPKVLFANLRTEPRDSFQLAERVQDVIRDLPTLTTVVSLDDYHLDDARCVRHESRLFAVLPGQRIQAP